MPISPPSHGPSISPDYWDYLTVPFNRSQEYATHPEYWSVFLNDVQVLDINGDGHLDVLLVYSYIPDEQLPGIPIRILLGDGHGNLTDATARLFPNGIPLGNAATGVSVADFNGDGVKDVFIPITWETPVSKDAHNILLLSDGHGGVVDASATLPNINDYSHWSARADIDGDGDIDIYVGNIGGHQYAPGGDTSSYFLINDGLGHFVRSDNRLPPLIESGDQQFTSALLFDADNDEDADMLLGMWGPQAALQSTGATASLILFNDGTGHFEQTAKSVLPPPLFNVDKAEVLGTQAADLNGDGFADLMLLIHDQHDRAIQVLINNGNGTFRDETSLRIDAAESDPRFTGRYFSLVDINADGALDLVLQTGGPERFYLNDGSGRFVALPEDFLFTSSPDGNFAFIPGDFNEDGRVDFFVRAYVDGWDDSANVVEFNSIALWRQPRGTVLTGDFNSNAVLGINQDEKLTGLGGDDVIFGAGGNDVLTGGVGRDYLQGGSGTDTVSYASDEGAVFVNLTLGQGYSNAAQGDTYTSIENVIGTSYNDFIIGDTGVNRLDGGAGNDTLIGAIGGDVLVGGSGNDTASYEDNSGTVFVNLTLNAGSNNAAQGDSYSGIENLIGGLFDDFFIGDEQANRLDGAMGADTLLGAGGADAFVFKHAPGAASGFTHPNSSANVDTILDFTTGVDKIELSKAAFSALGLGQLDASAFVTGTAAQDADDRIIYDQATGKIYYDADGSGSGAAVLFAVLDNKAPLAATDFVIAP